MIGNVIEKLTYLFIFSIIIFSPLPIGSVENWAKYCLQLQALLILLLWVSGTILQKNDPKIDIPKSISLLVFLFICLLQIIPLPESILAVLSSKSLEIWKESSSILAGLGLAEVKNTFTISLYPHATWRETLLVLSYIAFAFVVSKTFTSEGKIKLLLVPVLGVAIFEATYGIYQYLFNISQSAYPDLISATGTYVNRNHFAGFMEMSIPITLGYALSLGAWQEDRRQSLLRGLVSSDKIYKQILLLFLAGIMLLALLFSKSRMGMVSFLSSIFFFLIIYSGLRKDKLKIGITLAFVLSVTLFYGLWIGLYPAFERFLMIEGDAPGRILVWNDSLRALRDFPLFGTGLGTFSYVYPLYKESMEQPLVFSYAHNDYIQMAFETGILGFTSIMAGLFVLLVSSLKTLRRFSREGDHFGFFLGLGILTGIISILVHSLADFNLHIPSNALFFALLVGLLIAIGNKTKSVEVVEVVERKKVRVRRRRRKIKYDDEEIDTSI